MNLYECVLNCVFVELCSTRGERYDLNYIAADAGLKCLRTVLVFLERMKSEATSSARSGLDGDFETNINGDAQDDMASDVQEGAQSTVGSLVQRNGVVCTLHSAHSVTP